jgi:hypothetical protein
MMKMVRIATYFRSVSRSMSSSRAISRQDVPDLRSVSIERMSAILSWFAICGSLSKRMLKAA